MAVQNDSYKKTRHIDLWVIKIKKPMILCARSTSTTSKQNTKGDQAARTCERFVYSVVKITRLCDWNTSFEKSTRCAKDCALFS